MSVPLLFNSLGLSVSLSLVLALIIFLILLLSVAVLIAILGVAHSNLTSFLDFEAILPQKRDNMHALKKLKNFLDFLKKKLAFS